MEHLTREELMEKTVEALTTKQEKEALEGKLRGMGDAVARVLKSIGIRPCKGCKKRQEFLNKMIPFERK